jgi:arylsulfatase A-like enzyme
VIIIQADDLGIDDLGHRGNPWAHTPNLDRLATKSLQAMDFTVNPVCAPSRATLLTGRHFLRTGVHHVNGGKEFLHPEEKTLGDAFRAAGWKTGIWGKWHLGDGEDYLPWNRGFDEAYAARLYRHRQSEGRLNGNPVRHEAWADRVMVDYAIDFLKRHGDSPSLLYLPSLTPHTPLDAPEDWVTFHRERGLTGELAVLYAMVSHLDAQIGRLLEFLEETDRLENTLLIVTSDNGPAINRAQLTDEERSIRKVSARRGWKGDLWENGVRAPLLIHWPAQTGPGVIQRPLDQVDLLPTLLHWCGAPWPDTWPKQDGASWAPHPRILRNQETPPTRIFNYAHPGWITNERAWTPEGLPGEYNPLTRKERENLGPQNMPVSVREGRFKLLFNPFPPEDHAPGRSLLVDLYEDPGESTDVSAEHPEVTARLTSALTDWIRGVKADPHAFTYATHLLKPEATTRIPAHQPAGLSGGLNNTVNGLRNWGRVGQTADYHLRVPEASRGIWTLEWIQAPPENWEWSVSVNGTPSPIGSPVQLPAGDHRIRLELTSAPGAEKDAAPAILGAIIWTPSGGD